MMGAPQTLTLLPVQGSFTAADDKETESILADGPAGHGSNLLCHLLQQPDSHSGKSPLEGVVGAWQGKGGSFLEKVSGGSSAQAGQKWSGGESVMTPGGGSCRAPQKIRQ